MLFGSSSRLLRNTQSDLQHQHYPNWKKKINQSRQRVRRRKKKRDMKKKICRLKRGKSKRQILGFLSLIMVKKGRKMLERVICLTPIKKERRMESPLCHYRKKLIRQINCQQVKICCSHLGQARRQKVPKSQTNTMISHNQDSGILLDLSHRLEQTNWERLP